ncbi:MAG TPA: hypothetical protein VKI65_06365 [Gemmataceae bacterium]|nr:hypothetical protein [Gemmataceae bacterium]
MRTMTVFVCTLILFAADITAAEPPDLFDHGEGIELNKVIPANERGIMCLAADNQGRIYGGTTGRAAHLFVYDPVKNDVRSLARLDGGVGFAHGLIRLQDGSLIGGTQADPTGIAVKTEPKAVGHVYRFAPAGNGQLRVEDLGVPVPGQGIYTLAYLKKSNEIVGNTWPDGHFFTYDLKTKRFKDHGAIAGYRTFETPQHAEDINRGTDQKASYPRQVSRAIAVASDGAYTGGADGFLYRYDANARKLEKLKTRLPAVRGREPWASLDVAVVHSQVGLPVNGDSYRVTAGTSDGYLFEMTWKGGQHFLEERKMFSHGTIQGLVSAGDRVHVGLPVYGVGGNFDGMPRTFALSAEVGEESRFVILGGIPHVNGQPSMVGFGAMILDNKRSLCAGERDRIARLVRYRLKPKPPEKSAAPPGGPALPPADDTAPAKLPCHVAFAPQGTTTDGSGYTAIEVGKDGKVYVGAARYGDYAWLLRFDPAAKPVFMDKVVSLRQLSGERLKGVNTQAKIHSKIVVGEDGRIWFASKQGHEIFDTRPEYGEDYHGYPGGHLCYFDPKTGFSRSMGILKKQEGLCGGAIDNARDKLYYRTEPKNHFLVYDIKSGEVQDRGQVGNACRYMAMDKHGTVYTVGRGATMCRYDPETGYVEDLAVRIEGPGTYSPPYVIAYGPNGKLYGLNAGHPSVMEFDIDTYKPGPFPEVTMRNVAPAAPPGFPVLDIHAAVFGKDGKLYWPLNTNGPLEKGGKPVQQLRVMRFDPATKKVETVGVPDTSSVDEAKVRHTYFRKDAKFNLFHMQGSAVGEDGTLFLMGIYPQLHVGCFPKLTAPK